MTVTTTTTTTTTTREMMDSYIKALLARGPFAAFFADDVTLVIMSADQAVQGRDAVEGMIRYFHEQAFDANLEIKSLVLDEDRGALEADFVGRHTGEFAGAAASNRLIRVPYSVHYDFDAGRITALRIYGLTTDLLRAISD